MKNGLSTYIKLSRRSFLASLAAVAGGLGLTYWDRRTPSPSRLAGNDFSPNHRLGHLLRTGDLRKSPLENAPTSPSVIIVGGGIAGLSAGWWFKKNNFTDFEIWELEKDVGGNSRYSENAVSAFPWGAHYVPLPNEETIYLRTLFEELGVITGYDDRRKPVFNELYLCSDPQERLFYEGRWHESLIPGNIPETEKAEVKRFLNTMNEWRNRRGKDGKRAFAIPVDLSSQDEAFIALDRIPFTTWLDTHGYRSPFLRWYLNYCCRDDYGQNAGQVSAWAGLHYFAGRNAESANADSQSVLTWPNGNGWIVDKLRHLLSAHIKTERVAFRIENNGETVAADAWEMGAKRAIRYSPQKAIVATPRFVAGRLTSELREQATKSLVYSPWLVANLTLGKLPEGKGASLSWDNVSYYSRSLGYIVSTHQGLHPFPKKTVLTLYYPLDAEAPGSARIKAYQSTLKTWQELAVNELEKIHKGITEHVESVDVCVWGHGMISPSVGFIWGDLRREMARPVGHIHFAHSDMSGLSLFEEAQFHGVKAAEAVIKTLGRGPSA